MSLAAVTEGLTENQYMVTPYHRETTRREEVDRWTGRDGQVNTGRKTNKTVIRGAGGGVGGKALRVE